MPAYNTRPLLLPRRQTVDGTEALELVESGSRFRRVTQQLPGTIQLILRRSVARGQRGGAFQRARRIARAVERRIDSSGQLQRGRIRRIASQRFLNERQRGRGVAGSKHQAGESELRRRQSGGLPVGRLSLL